MDLPGNNHEQTDADAQDIYTFRREEGLWLIDLPSYTDLGWTTEDLRMTEGAHKFLNRLAGGAQKLRLRLSTLPVVWAGVLELVELCDTPRGGAIYLYVKHQKETEGELFWICDLALLVFGDMPERIYVQRLHDKNTGQREKTNNDPFRKEKGPVDGFSPNTDSSTTEYHHYGQSFYHQLPLRK